MTSTDIATTGGSALAIATGQQGWTDDQIAVLRQIGTEKATASDMKLFFHQCSRTGLDPFARQIYLVEYGGKATIQTGIDGFRLVARRAADKAGESLEYEDVQWCGPDGQWTDVWLSEDPPAAARAVVLRDGKKFPAVTLYREYVGLKNEYGADRKPTGRKVPNSMWTTKPAHMLGKCAEAGALRKAFPQDLGGLYVAEEMDHRTVVTGEVVAEQVPAVSSLPQVLELVAAATTRDELLAIWNNYAPGLSVADRARLQAAGQQALELLEQGPPPASAPEPSNPATDAGPDLGALLDALNALGYRDEVDQLAFVGTVLSQTVDALAGIGSELGWLVGKLQEAATASDPQAYLDDLLSGVTP
jgi:phage recombination protein Bet